ncbi:hypothetical protein Salat_2988500 [Sesamum alatum]|uniref:Uncharacterized protein n=1 Tax=Sesamum alatum TaxID=300844 RepID=A0AAE2C7V5_9LAMI|nr:hypothetical protein Salat_2988500 [Sesamum alatum]
MFILELSLKEAFLEQAIRAHKKAEEKKAYWETLRSPERGINNALVQKSKRAGIQKWQLPRADSENPCEQIQNVAERLQSILPFLCIGAALWWNTLSPESASEIISQVGIGGNIETANEIAATAKQQLAEAGRVGVQEGEGRGDKSLLAMPEEKSARAIAVWVAAIALTVTMAVIATKPEEFTFTEEANNDEYVGGFSYRDELVSGEDKAVPVGVVYLYSEGLFFFRVGRLSTLRKLGLLRAHGRTKPRAEGGFEYFPYVSRISMIDLLSIEEANNIYELNENPALLSSIGRDLRDCHSIPFDMGHENEIYPYTPRKGVALTPEEERSWGRPSLPYTLLKA